MDGWGWGLGFSTATKRRGEGIFALVRVEEALALAARGCLSLVFVFLVRGLQMSYSFGMGGSIFFLIRQLELFVLQTACSLLQSSEHPAKPRGGEKKTRKETIDIS